MSELAQMSEPEDQEPEGVWVSFMWDTGPAAVAVHRTEIEARRFAMENHHDEVRLLPFDEVLR